MTRRFERHDRVRFGWCDPAGIVYYPKYFDLFHEAMEAWFPEATGESYAAFIQRGRGLPSVHAEADYRAPLRLGDAFTVALETGPLGRSSLPLAYTIVADDGVLRATGKVVTVLMNLEPGATGDGRALPWPDALRRAIEGWQRGRGD